ncbi:MAG: phosphotransferase, partial [Acidobacteria bacterium]|nr:phosphotransferase [Acidobacteriota bacterium]
MPTSERRQPENATARDRVQEYLDRSAFAGRGVRVVPLTGDASDRRYFRLLVPDQPSRVLSLYPGPFEYRSMPFVNVANLLAEMPVPIPAILDHADDLGVLILQDLGDVTLQAHLGAAPPADHAALYRQAVALIDVLQRRGAELTSDAYVPYRVAFDVEKLTWELDFFIKHFLEAYRGVVLDDATRGALRAELGTIVQALAAEPRVLCHRDYHSRNLMLHESELYIIDFQDARMGPDTYDLVSLVRDSYMDLTEQTVEDLIAYFLALKGLAGQEREFRERFDVMALQRNLKALGTFGYMTIARRNPVYIQYIPRTLRYV